MIRLSPSVLQSFLYWRDGTFYTEEAENQALEDLVRAIKGEKAEPSDAMLLGRAWHAALEVDPGPVDLVHVTEEGQRFSFSGESVRDMRGEMPPGIVHELWGSLDLPELDVTMRLRVDGIHGTVIHEAKSTSRVSVDKYMESPQWVAYLLAFECRKCIYHLVRLNKDRKTGVYSIGEYLPLPLYAFRSMREDLVRDVRSLLWFMADRNLTEHRTVDPSEASP